MLSAIPGVVYAEPEYIAESSDRQGFAQSSADTNYKFSTNIDAHQVTLSAATTTITMDVPDPSVTGESVPVTVTVAGDSETPTGTVDITGADANCSITLAGGTGSCNIVFNSAGAKTITATYSGDGYYDGSTDTEDHQVTLSATSATVTADVPDPAFAESFFGIWLSDRTSQPELRQALLGAQR